MSMLYSLIIIESILLLVGVYVIYNLVKKNDIYEDTIQKFYAQASYILYTMRYLDAKQMFETDDEVGTLFEQMRDLIFTLEPLIEKDTDEEKE